MCTWQHSSGYGSDDESTPVTRAGRCSRKASSGSMSCLCRGRGVRGELVGGWRWACDVVRRACLMAPGQLQLALQDETLGDGGAGAHDRKRLMARRRVTALQRRLELLH